MIYDNKKNMGKKRNGKLYKGTNFQKYLAKKLKNPEFRKYYEEYDKQLEIAY
jgi:hypothetical protein